jgi:hypothetical protein
LISMSQYGTMNPLTSLKIRDSLEDGWAKHIKLVNQCAIGF